MSADPSLADISASYDTVAASYAELFRDGLGRDHGVRGALALFAELLRDGGGPVADVGCGPGHVTAHLRDLGLDVFGIDLSPAMIDIARTRNPGLRFTVGSMTELDLPDRSLGGLLAWYSVIHLPDDLVCVALTHFYRVLRPGGVIMLGFHVGDLSVLKTQGYGGHPMKVRVYRRPLTRMARWLRDAGFRVEVQLLLDPEGAVPGGVLLARRPVPVG